MSKVHPDADWTMCWSIWKGYQKESDKNVHPSNIKEDDFVAVEGQHDSSYTSPFMFGFNLLAWKYYLEDEYKFSVEVD
jgi:hypothetical protein